MNYTVFVRDEYAPNQVREVGNYELEMDAKIMAREMGGWVMEADAFKRAYR